MRVIMSQNCRVARDYANQRTLSSRLNHVQCTILLDLSRIQGTRSSGDTSLRSQVEILQWDRRARCADLLITFRPLYTSWKTEISIICFEPNQLEHWRVHSRLSQNFRTIGWGLPPQFQNASGSPPPLNLPHAIAAHNAIPLELPSF